MFQEEFTQISSIGKQKLIFMKKQDMILYEMKNLDIYELEKEQLEFVVDTLIDNIKLSNCINNKYIHRPL